MANEPTTPKRKFIGFSEALETRRAQREARTTPQPWIVRKLTVGIVLALWIYAYYVYLARLCWEPLVHASRANPVINSRGAAVGLFIVFNLLWLMFGWSYFKVILTPPGYARDHVQPVPRPEFTDRNDANRVSWDSDADEIGGPAYTHTTSPTQTIAAASRSATSQTISNGGHGGYVYSHRTPIDTEKAMSGEMGYPRQSTSPILEAGVTDTLPGIHRSADLPSGPHRPIDPKLMPVHPKASAAEEAKLAEARKHGVTTAYVSRQPPTHPVLLPEYRYCGREGFIKPFRCHHCRICATCVLKYDHHCPWIGQCVGARNQKFFVIFLMWSSIFTGYTFSTILASQVKQSLQIDNFDIDPQQIVILVIAGIFTLFTVSLFTTQCAMILMNTTTVEHMNMRGMKEREQAVLSRLYPMWAFRAKRKTKREWDEEWGKIVTEGNIWWQDGMEQNWKSVMGSSMIRWILPIGSSPSDGLSFPRNPRFDADGRWRRRKDWPKELQ